MTGLDGTLGAPAFADGYSAPEEIGRGGFSVVYRAHEDAFDRIVAVKVLQGAGWNDDLQTRFERECRAVGALCWHPNIVTVYRAGRTATGAPFLAMELAPGGSYADRVSRVGPLPPAQAVAVGVAIAGAVEAAHRADRLHRDLKPENILLSQSGSPMLADFGISALRSATATTSAGITASIAHAAPEVLAGARATVASDVYSLGSTVYALMAGRGAFVSDGDEGLGPLFRRIALDPPPDLRPRGVPDAVCAVLERAMAKEPSERQESALAFGEALQAAEAAAGFDRTPIVTGADGVDGGGAPAAADPDADIEARETRIITREGGRPSTPAPAPAPEDDTAPIVESPSGGEPPVGEPSLPGPAAPTPRAGAGKTLAALGIAAVMAVVLSLVAFSLTRADAHPKVKLIDVASRPADDADAALVKAGFRVIRQDTPAGPAAPGTVVGTKPPAGSRLERGAAVTLLIARTDAIAVPGLSGLPLDQAVARLQAAGLLLGTTSRQATKNAPVGTVVSTEPAEGVGVPKGTAVNIVLAEAEAPPPAPPADSGTTVPSIATTQPTQPPKPETPKVTVPNVVGLTTAEATQRLRSARLIVSEQHANSDSVATGRIIRSDPSSGAVVAEGATVNIFVSDGKAGPAVDSMYNVTEQSAGFSWTGPNQRSANTGLGGHMFWTTATPSEGDACAGTTVHDWARWSTALPATGVYHVDVYVPNDHANTTNARYLVFAEDGQHVVALNQNSWTNKWIRLGSWRMSSGRIELNDITFEACNREIAFDDIRWVYKGP